MLMWIFFRLKMVKYLGRFTTFLLINLDLSSVAARRGTRDGRRHLVASREAQSWVSGGVKVVGGSSQWQAQAIVGEWRLAKDDGVDDGLLASTEA